MLGITHNTQDAAHETGCLCPSVNNPFISNKGKLLYFTFTNSHLQFIEALDSQHTLAALESLSFQSVRTYKAH